MSYVQSVCKHVIVNTLKTNDETVVIIVNSQNR